jgi:hypothetical protein
MATLNGNRNTNRKRPPYRNIHLRRQKVGFFFAMNQLVLILVMMKWKIRGGLVDLLRNQKTIRSRRCVP